MDVEVVKRFRDSAQTVLQSEVGGPIEFGQLSVQALPYTSQQVTTLIGLTGNVEGVLLLGLSDETARMVVSHMMGEQIEELNDLAQSCITEMGNVIAGTAATGLSGQNACTISPPTLLLGSGSRVSTPGIQRLVIPIITPCGVLEMQLALQPKSNPLRSDSAKSLAYR
jgi:chemotaxis protein CheX